MSAIRQWAARLWSAAPVVAFVALFPIAASAQSIYAAQQPDTSYVSSWQRLRDLSLQLENLAANTRDEAKIDAEHHHGSHELAERVDDFAKDAHALRLLTDERGVPASKINDHIRKLVDDARKVQKESADATRHYPRTDTDWTRTVAVLNEINNEYLAANGLAPQPRGTAGMGPYRNDVEGRRMLISDLDRRADDAARLAESGSMDIAPEIERLRDQIVSYRRQMDDLSVADRRANIAHMLADARAAQADLSGSNAPAQLRDDVNSIVGMLVQMRDMTAEGAEGTRGYGPPPMATDRDRDRDYVDMSEFAQDLDGRAARANDMIVQQSTYDDIANDVAHFRDKTRDFYDRQASMSRNERRDAIDSLLKDAQKTQRDLVRRRASDDLVSQWNGIVELLTRMRNVE